MNGEHNWEASHYISMHIIYVLNHAGCNVLNFTFCHRGHARVLYGLQNSGQFSGQYQSNVFCQINGECWLHGKSRRSFKYDCSYQQPCVPVSRLPLQQELRFVEALLHWILWMFGFWVFHSTVLHSNLLCELNRPTQYCFCFPLFGFYSLLVFRQHVSAYLCHLQVTLGTYSRILKYFSLLGLTLCVTYSCTIGLWSVVTSCFVCRFLCYTVCFIMFSWTILCVVIFTYVVLVLSILCVIIFTCAVLIVCCFPCHFLCIITCVFYCTYPAAGLCCCSGLPRCFCGVAGCCV
jgi:hypothetical protein